MQIDFASEVPIYVQIADQLSDAILTGAFPEAVSYTHLTRVWKPVGPPCNELGPLLIANWCSSPYKVNFPLAIRLP